MARNKRESKPKGKLADDSNEEYIPKKPLDPDALVNGVRGIVVKPKTQGHRNIVEAHNNNDIIFAIGPAGSGKTYMAVALAVKALNDKEIKKIILVRPAVEAGEKLGFLPGDLKSKVDPYLRPLYDALEDMIETERLAKLLELNVIEVAPLAYMRGRTLNKAFIIMDEAQNATETQMKMLLTRMGNGSKIIITGDITQIDLPKNIKSGIFQCLDLLSDIQGIGIVKMSQSDVVRHPLVKKIISAYDKKSENLHQSNDENNEIE